jgi:membrane protein YqaA with SNARE-associated domain
MAFGVTGVVLTVVCMLYAHRWESLADAIEQGGYGALFAASVVSGFNLAVPLPVISFFRALVDAGMDPMIIIAVISSGMTVADGLGFVLGSAARRINGVRAWTDSPHIGSLRTQHTLRIWFALTAYAAFIPLPNELVVVPLAVARVRARVILTAVFVGNLIFNSLMALGVNWLHS